ncbi:hypothetical protein BJX64DRAFT_257384 [Aspergillus heterothallicus]
MSRYTAIKDEEAETDSDIHAPSPPTRPSNSSRWPPLAAAFTLGALLSATITTLIPTLATKPSPDCTQTLSTYSPALTIFTDTDLTPTRFNGALRAPNRFRGDPSPEIDEAWAEILYAEGGLVRLTREEIERVNASEYAAEYTADLGGGYIAGVEVFHQLHCLNMLRQVTYWEYYAPIRGEWARDPGTLRYHLDHCIDMLRQKLMCDADVGMITYVWAKGWKQAFPDFSTVHKCRPYSKVLDWARDNYVHGSRNVADIERAPGAKERETRP